MDVSRKANREQDEITLQYQSRREVQLIEELNEGKLAQLLAFVDRLEQTPPGAAELKERVALLGVCQPMEEETSSQFYARLRHWLDRDLPGTTSPRRAPRQTDD